MKKYGYLFFAALSILLIFGATLATAQEPIPRESGFSGFVRPGVGYLNFRSNMVASFFGFDLSDKKTDSLDDSPDSQSTGIALVPFALEYTYICQHPHPVVFGNGFDGFDPVLFRSAAGCQTGDRQAWHSAGRFSV